MKRAQKIKLAEEAAIEAMGPDDRDPAAREGARQEWAQVRKAAREAFLGREDFMAILNDYKAKEGFYTEAERAKMCTSYTDELMMNARK